jgi:endonuclease III
MSNRSSGRPRQPLSQKRPKAASSKRPSGVRPASVPATKRGNGKLPRPKKAPVRGRRIADLPAHSAEVYRRLLATYPDAHCELDHRSAWELLVATILSAQTTDRRVNMVTPALFTKYPGPAELALAPQDDVEEIIKSTGFFRNKAKSIISMARSVIEHHGGQVPSTMNGLTSLAGVGRKTANVVLGNAFDVNVGVVVDTHVHRLSNRLGLTRQDTPEKIEQDLVKLFPSEQWTMLSHLLIWHGRRICEAKKPNCPGCPLVDICPAALV